MSECLNSAIWELLFFSVSAEIRDLIYYLLQKDCICYFLSIDCRDILDNLFLNKYCSTSEFLVEVVTPVSNLFEWLISRLLVSLKYTQILY